MNRDDNDFGRDGVQRVGRKIRTLWAVAIVLGLLTCISGMILTAAIALQATALSTMAVFTVTGVLSSFLTGSLVIVLVLELLGRVLLDDAEQAFLRGLGDSDD